MALTIASTLRMNDGREIPRMGLGVYQTPVGQKTREAVAWALEAGYRHIDSAKVYGNERDVGAAVRASGIPREQIFVTTKLWNSDQGYESALKAGRRSNETLGLGYIDLYLIHWPVERLRNESWRALVELQKEGVCRSIGVSNFEPRHLDELRKHSPVVPAVNQVEMSPFLAQRSLRDYCARTGIVIEAYSPLTRGELFGAPVLQRVAAKHGKTPAQILIRWALQQDVVVLPKSVHHERIVENAAVYDFELDAEDLGALDDVDRDHRTAWDPTDVP